MNPDLHRHDPQDATVGHARERVSGKVLGIAVTLTLLFAAAEFVAALISGSVALMADAGHMVTDATALFLALAAQIMARRPPTEQSSYGHGRIEALAAFVNSLAMLGLAGWISIEALTRFTQPHAVDGMTVMIVAAIGLMVNLVVAWVLSRDQGSLNTRAALIHVLGDLLGSVAALASGAIILLTGWTPIDPILSLVVCALILKSTFGLLKTTYGILMEHVPAHVSFRGVANDLGQVATVMHIHNLHIWETSPGHVTLTAHLEISDMTHWPVTLREIQVMLREKHGIDHATLQPEPPHDQVSPPQNGTVMDEPMPLA